MTSPSHRPTDDRRLAAVVLILGGSLWVLALVGFVPAGFLRAASALWPLAAIGLGLDVVGVRRGPFGIPYSVVAVVVIGITGLFFPGSPTGAAERAPGTTTTTTFTEAIGAARRAELDIRAPGTGLALHGGVDPDMLVQAATVGRAVLSSGVAGRSVRRIELSSESHGGRTASVSATVDVRVTDQIPLELDVATGERSSTIDLTGLDIARFGYIGARGAARIILTGAGPERYDAHIAGDEGPIDVDVPRSARINLRLEPGRGGAIVSLGPRSDVSLTLRTGAGPVVIDVPDDARIQVVVADAGDGILALPDRIARVRGRAEGEAEDTYQTADFREVIPTIVIRIEESGSGPIQIR